jgi:uncharacterized protein GlcG (DUF336 family)
MNTARPCFLAPVRRGLGAAALATLLLASSIGHALNPPPAAQSLSRGDVVRILRQAVLAARDRGVPATIVVVDRVGNVLAVFRMTGARSAVRINAGRPVEGTPGVAAIAGGSGLAGLAIPAAGAAIAKAITGAYLSSAGNAFSTRTASAIVQENFVPGSEGLEGGPLFGVQFSSLPCSDLNTRFATDAAGPLSGVVSASVGPKRSPAGLSADPGGFPLYKSGTLVGGIGVAADSVYGLDRDIRNRDDDVDEFIALAGTAGYESARDIRADRVTVDGRLLRYADFDASGFRSYVTRAATLNPLDFGAYVPINGYFAATSAVAGTVFGQPPSGFTRDPDNLFGSTSAFVLVDGLGRNRYPPRAGNDGPNALTAGEVTVILREALAVALAARGQIRRPLNSNAEVTISVVDTNGNIRGLVRTPDAPVFGTDVSVQKARSAMFFSSRAVDHDLRLVGLGGYADRMRTFLGATAVGGSFGYSNRAVGNIARPFYPDGVNGRAHGPLSVTINRWSPFSTGLQLDLVLPVLAQHLGFVATGAGDVQVRCAGLARLGNGLQIFPGGVPIYRGTTLVGGIGVSGDGIDQDDMVAFLGLARASQRLTTGIQHAPPASRADRLAPRGANLRYVQCPFAPFLGSNAQSVCRGL